MDFTGKKVLVGVSGGIAAYKAAEVVRLFVKAGATVNVVMTKHATEFITPLTMQTLCGNPVLTELFDLQSGAEIKHVSLADEADVVVLVPATANLIGKLANAIADDLLTSMLLVARCPVVIAPAMNVSMWEHPIVAQNLNRLREVLGYQVVEPAEGLLACGYEGKGKLADPEEIVSQVSTALDSSPSLSSVASSYAKAPEDRSAKEGGPCLPKPVRDGEGGGGGGEFRRVVSGGEQDLAGKKVLITAGPTREYLDPVRYLSNPSTGKMGIAVAEAAAERGAEVTLVLGPTHLKPSGKVKTVNVETADEMYAAASEAYAGADVFIASAAVADYKPAKRETQKVKKRPADEPLTLVRTPDILLELSKNKGKRVLVGFAAETTNVVEHAREKLTKKNCDLIVANDVTEQGSGFGTDTNRVMLVSADNVESLPVLHKREVADRILDRVLRLL